MAYAPRVPNAKHDMSSASNLRRWAIPMAATIPAFAIAFAFSLGPSPRKVVADYLRSDAPAEQRIAALEVAGEGVVRALAERIHEPGLPHKREAIAFLVDRADPQALPALERVCSSPEEPPAIRKQALEGALAIDRSRGLALAEGLAGRADELGAAARRALATQERTELSLP